LTWPCTAIKYATADWHHFPCAEELMLKVVLFPRLANFLMFDNVFDSAYFFIPSLFVFVFLFWQLCDC